MEYVQVFQQAASSENHDLAMHARKRTGEISTLYWPQKTHASILLDISAQADILKAITISENIAKENCKKTELVINEA